MNFFTSLVVMSVAGGSFLTMGEMGQEVLRLEEGKEPVKLQITSMIGGTSEQYEVYQDILENYTDKHPEVSISYLDYLPYTKWKKVFIESCEAGNEPDVMMYFNDRSLAKMIEKDAFVSIEEIRKVYPEYASNINEYAFNSHFYPEASGYYVPIGGFYEGLYINKDLFEKYNVELPTDWEKFEKAIVAFSETNVVPLAVDVTTVPHYAIEHFLLAEGGLTNYRNKDITQAKEMWINALRHFETFGELDAFYKRKEGDGFEAAFEAFNNKEAAVYFDGSWINHEIIDQENTLIMPIPSHVGEDERRLIGGFGQGWFITRKAWEDPNKREAAAALVTELTNNESIKLMIQAVGVGATPANIGEVEGLLPVQQRGTKLTGEMLDMALPTDSWMEKESWDIIMKGVQDLVNGQKSAEQVYEMMLESVNQ